MWESWAPVGRLGWPEDQARVALFLASDLSALRHRPQHPGRRRHQGRRRLVLVAVAATVHESPRRAVTRGLPGRASGDHRRTEFGAVGPSRVRPITWAAEPGVSMSPHRLRTRTLIVASTVVTVALDGRRMLVIGRRRSGRFVDHRLVGVEPHLHRTRRRMDRRLPVPRHPGRVQQGRRAQGRRPRGSERPGPGARHLRRVRVLRPAGRRHREGRSQLADLVHRAPPEPRRGPVEAQRVQGRRHRLRRPLQLLPRLPQGPCRRRPLPDRSQRRPSPSPSNGASRSRSRTYVASSTRRRNSTARSCSVATRSAGRS